MQKDSVRENDEKFIRMTTQPVEKLINKLAIPTIISMLITSFYNLADTFFVRQLNNDSMIAAVGVVMPLMTIIQAIGFYHGHGSGNYISRAYGAQDFSKASKMAATGFFYSFGFGLLLAVLGLIFKNGTVELLGAKTAATRAYTAGYMTYILIAAPFMTGAIVINNQLRLQGNAFFSMIGLTSGAVLNMVLDPIFIFKRGDVILGGALTVPFGAGMDVTGAALATCISQIFAFFMLLFGLYRSDSIKIRLKNFSFDGFYIRNIVKGGLPSLARQGMATVAAACVNHAIGIYIEGDALIDAAQAALTGVNKIMQFLFSAIIGFGQGFQPVCGFNYGAKKYDRVLRAFWYCVRVGVIAILILGVIGFIFARPIVNTVAGASEAASDIAVFAFRAHLTTLALIVWVSLCNMMMQNIGDTTRATVLAMSRQGLTLVPVVLLLPALTRALGGGTLLGLQLAQPVSDVFSFLIAVPLGLGTIRDMKNKMITDQ